VKASRPDRPQQFLGKLARAFRLNRVRRILAAYLEQMLRERSRAIDVARLT
jgi:hypothetical protein